MSAAGGGGREVAYRCFATEYDDATLSHAESDEERAPNYVITPTGARVNRLFVVGTLTEVDRVNDEMVRARVVDPTGAFVIYAGQYQPEALAYFEDADPPAFVAVTGKARTFEPEDGDRVFTSIRPESVASVDADTRDRWVLDAAERTLERIGACAGACTLDDGAGGTDRDALTDALLEAGLEEGLATGIPIAREHYETTPAYLSALRLTAIDAIANVAGDRENVRTPTVEPAGTDDGAATFADLATNAPFDLEAARDGLSDRRAKSVNDDQVTGGEATSSTDDFRVTSESTTDPGSDATSTSAEDPKPDTDSETVADSPPRTDDDSDASVDEPSTTDDRTDDGTGDDEIEELGDFDGGSDELYELDEAERAAVEAEHGVEFTTASDVESESADADADGEEKSDESATDGAVETDETTGDGLAGGTIETVDEVGETVEKEVPADDPDEDTARTDDVGEEETPTDDVDEAATTDDVDEEEAPTDGLEKEEAPANDVDLDELVIERMADLDGGDGADRQQLVETLTEETSAGASAVEDAIQDALMGGRCYEPEDGRLKPI